MLSKMDADRLELELRRLPWNNLWELRGTAQPRAVEKDLRLSVSMDKKLPDIAGDRRRLTEVLQNLLDNAIQYTPAGGQSWSVRRVVTAKWSSPSPTLE